MSAEEEPLVDYEEDSTVEVVTDNKDSDSKTTDLKKGSYAGVHSSGFRDFLLKPEILRAVADCAFEHPSEVQQECIPQAVLGMDVICQAKSGMGKTAVFVLATLQQIQPEDGVIDTLVLCHTRELAYQICQEFERFSKYMPGIKVAVFFGGILPKHHQQILKTDMPHIVVGTPGRIKQLVADGDMKVNKLKRFILDECDQLLESLEMRRDVQQIFKATPHEKQVMMFSATLSNEIRPICRKFTQNAIEIFVDDSKLRLHGLQQFYVKLTEQQKNKKLNDLLDLLDFNQVVIFVNGVRRCRELLTVLTENNFPAIGIYRGMPQDERIAKYNQFKDCKSRICVATDIFGRGVDFERVNIVINYDMPPTADAYLHRVGRSGRFGTKGLAVTFVASPEDSRVLEDVQSRFVVEIPQLPAEIDVSSYM